MENHANPNHEGNSKEYRTGKICINMGCANPAGTAWSPLFCQPCNTKRMEKIDGSFKKLLEGFWK